MKSKKEKDVILMTREETRDFFKTSFPTIRKWTVDGIIKAYQIGGRVYYKKNELLNALVKVEV